MRMRLGLTALVAAAVGAGCNLRFGAPGPAETASPAVQASPGESSTGSPSPAPTDDEVVFDPGDGEAPGQTAKPAPTVTTRSTQPPPVVRAVDVELEPRELTLNFQPRVGESPIWPFQQKLAVTVLLTDVSTQDQATWLSTNPQIAFVDEAGLVTAGSATGGATIVATSLDGAASGSCQVTVTDFGAAEVVLE